MYVSMQCSVVISVQRWCVPVTGAGWMWSSVCVLFQTMQMGMHPATQAMDPNSVVPQLATQMNQLQLSGTSVGTEEHHPHM